MSDTPAALAALERLEHARLAMEAGPHFDRAAYCADLALLRAALTDVDRVREECAAVCDRMAAGYERHLGSPDEVASDKATVNTARECAKRIRSFAAREVK